MHALKVRLPSSEQPCNHTDVIHLASAVMLITQDNVKLGADCRSGHLLLSRSTIEISGLLLFATV